MKLQHAREAIVQDVRFAFRTLVKRPVFSAVAVTTLAIGMGAYSALFTVVNTVLLDPLPYAEPDRLVQLRMALPERGIDQAPASGPYYFDWREQSRAFEALAGYAYVDLNLTGTERPERLAGARVTPSLFPVLGVEPALGRTFSPEEGEKGGQAVAVLSHGLWQRRFGADSEILGRTVKLHEKVYTVVGVMPPEFEFAEADIWVPLVFTAAEANLRLRLFLEVVGRLAPGTSIDAALSDVQSIVQRVADEEGGYAVGWAATITSLHDQLVGDVRPALLTLFGAVSFVLLLAAVNVANLMLVRSADRLREVAVSAALGAGRLRVVSQVMTESLVLALIGGAAGLLLAYLSSLWLLAIRPAHIPRVDEIGIDARVLAVTLAVAVVTGLLFGLVPALRAARVDLHSALKTSASRSGKAGRPSHGRSLLVVVQVAMALVLLIGAGLTLRSFGRVLDVDPGFDRSGVLTTRLSLSGEKYPEEEHLGNFQRQLLEALGALPGVSAAGISTSLPLGMRASLQNYHLEGEEAGEVTSTAYVDAVSPEYFEAMGVSLVQGRIFTDQDRRGGPPLVIVDEVMARRLWPGESAVGRRIELRGVGHVFREVVGVVREVKRDGLDVEARGPQAYVPYSQWPQSEFNVVLRTESDPLALVSPLRRQVASLDADLPLEDVNTMEGLLARSLSERRFSMQLMGIFAVVALVLAMVGIYGVISYLVNQRTQEIGVRLALGANRRQVLELFLRQGLRLTAVGLGVGFAAALGLTRLMAGLIYGISVNDPLTLVSTAVILALVALVAVYIPSRRATRVDPTEALRYE